MKLSHLTSVLFAASAFQLAAQEITPIWVQHIAPFGTEANGKNSTVLVNVDPVNQLPILAGSRVEPNNNEDGSETQPVFVRLQRYDDKRLILFVSENGINESDPTLSPEQIALAAQYPDKSLVWIDAATGAPLGVAFHEADHPALNANPPIDVQDPSTGNQNPAYDPVFTFYWRPALDDGAPGKKVLYSGINHLILRYEMLPDGTGWSNVPTVAYAESIPGYGDGLTDDHGGNAGDNARRWRWRNFRVSGSGKDTQIIGGGGTWRPGMHTQLLVTDDGLTFHPRGRVDDRSGGIRNDYSGGGTGSRVVRYGLDPAHPNLEVYYQGHYPAYAYNSETPERYISDPDNLYAGQPNVVAYNQQPDVAMFEPTPGLTNVLSGVTNNLPPFLWEEAGRDGRPIDKTVDGIDRYDGGWSMNVEANADLDYIVSYSSPSWNNVMPVPRPGWIGIHRLDGSISGGAGSAYKIPVTERDAPAPGVVGNEAFYNAWIEVNPDKAAPANLKKAEILGAFGPAGFGIFTVQNTPAAVKTQPTGGEVLAGSDVTLHADISGSPSWFQWTRNGVPLADGHYIQGSKTVTLTLKKVVPADSGEYKLEVTNPLKNATTTAAVVKVGGAYLRPADGSLLDNAVATASSTAFGGPPALAIDGNTDGNWGGGSVFHSDNETNPWLEIDLGATKPIGQIVYYRRTDCCQDRSDNLLVSVLSESRDVVWSYQVDGTPDNPLALDAAGTSGRIVRVERNLDPSKGYLNIAEVQVFSADKPQLAIGSFQGDAVIAWAGGGTLALQQSSSINGPYEDVQDAVSPLRVTPGASSAKFYRVVTK